MRSLLVALVLAAPVCAVANTPNPVPTYTHPIDAVHAQKEKPVFLTFVNFTPQEREVRIGNVQYRMRDVSVLHVYAPVGSVVRLYSASNSKVNGEELMKVAATDSGRNIFLK